MPINSTLCEFLIYYASGSCVFLTGRICIKSLNLTLQIYVLYQDAKYYRTLTTLNCFHKDLMG